MGSFGVVVYVKDVNGNTLNTVRNINGTIYVDDIVVGHASSWTNMVVGSGIVPYATGTITWKAWEDFYPITIETGGMSTALLAAAISAAAPWIGVFGVMMNGIYAVNKMSKPPLNTIMQKKCERKNIWVTMVRNNHLVLQV